ncbi:uncharacterized protein [Euphorbia lathyris]|uniref:uncharacterized protein n=1 Tax=Euphorbia lathyris TaxID=212925 RepID=UPI0033141205
MGRKKKAKEKLAPPTILHSIVSAIPAPEGRTPADLKRLYVVLVHLSLNSHSGLFYPDVASDKFGVNFNFKDIHYLSDVLFKELDQGFEELFSALHDVSAIRVADIWAKREQLMLHLRCCLVILTLLAFNQQLLIDKGRILLSNLSRLISVQLGFGRNGKGYFTIKRSISLECAYVDGDCTASVSEEFVASVSSLDSPSCYVLLCSLLEVFADELLLHESLRGYFMLIDSSSSRSEMLFNLHFGHGNVASALEVISAHFILSVTDEHAFANSINRLYWCHGEDLRTPEISLPAALSLLLNPVVLSAPKLFQAHLISLVAEAINISTAENVILDSQSIKRYLTALERSVMLYGRHISSLDIDNHHFSGEVSSVKSCGFGKNQLNFESFLLQVTVDKLHHLIAKPNRSWDSYVSKFSFGKNSDLVGPSIAYVKDNMCIFDDAHKYEVLSILNCIILGCSSGDTTGTLLWKGETIPHDTYFLASVLKLMSSSMLQTIRHAGFSSPLKSKQGVTSCMEYNCILDILSCFQQFSVHLSAQNFLSEEVRSHLARHKENKRMMLLHLLGTLSSSYASGVDFLIKGCLFTIMTLLNLFIIEEGDLNALASQLISRSRSFSSENVERVVARKSSHLISSKFQKIQDLYLRQRSIVHSEPRKQDNQAEASVCASVLPSLDSAPDDNVESCNGQTYLKCVLGKNSKVDDFDDLADFIECKGGKDYSGWLKDREKYRRWKYEKMVTLRWKKKKKAMKSMR